MPAAAQFTPAFVESFVLACRADGLTKEATVDLLYLAATDAAHRHESFAEGFNQRLAVEKSAWALAGKALATVAGATGLGYLGNKAYEGAHNYNRESWGGAPVVGGGYDAKASKQSEKDELATKSKGLYSLNQNAYNNDKRRGELQGVADSGGPGVNSAGAELQGLRGDYASKKRDAYGRELESYGATNADHLATVQGDLKDLNSSRNSWWNKARNFMHMGHDFDADERQLWDQQENLGRQGRINGKLQERLNGHVVSGDPDEIIEPKDLRSRFLNTQ